MKLRMKLRTLLMITIILALLLAPCIRYCYWSYHREHYLQMARQHASHQDYFQQAVELSRLEDEKASWYYPYLIAHPEVDPARFWPAKEKYAPKPNPFQPFAEPRSEWAARMRDHAAQTARLKEQLNFHINMKLKYESVAAPPWAIVPPN